MWHAGTIEVNELVLKTSLMKVRAGGNLYCKVPPVSLMGRNIDSIPYCFAIHRT